MEFSYSVILSLKQQLHAMADLHVQLRKSIFEDAQVGFKAAVWFTDFSPTANLSAPPWSLSGNFTMTEHLEQAKAILGIEQIWFEDIQDKRETLTYPGVVSCSAQTFELLQQINQLRADFKAFVVDIKKTHRRLKDLDIEERLMEIGWFKRDKIVREAFRQAGISRLCLKQIYRNIPLWDCETQGELIGIQFYQKYKRPIVKTTIGQQLKLLNKRRLEHNTPALEQACSILNQYPMDLSIAQIKNACRIVTANIKFKRRVSDDSSDKGVIERTQRPSVLPIFYRSTPHLPLVTHDFSALAVEPPIRAKRRDCKLEEEPFLGAWHLYHYLKE